MYAANSFVCCVIDLKLFFFVEMHIYELDEIDRIVCTEARS